MLVRQEVTIASFSKIRRFTRTVSAGREFCCRPRVPWEAPESVSQLDAALSNQPKRPPRGCGAAASRL